VSAGSTRSIVVVPAFLEDVRWWVATQPRVALRLLDLVEPVMRDPFRGIGKPEPLKNLGADTWSRRITQEHRLVYRVFDDGVEFLQARRHY
jgi:toxin YoeB